MFLPIFPLRIIVFPNEEINLHVFEPRYKQMLNECEETGISFGIPVFMNKQIMEYGTEVKLLNIEKRHPNGEMDVKCLGKQIFKVNRVIPEVPHKLYSGAEVDVIENVWERDIIESVNIIELVTELYEILNIKKAIPVSPEDVWTYNLAHHAGFTAEQEYNFLKIDTEIKRQLELTKHLKDLIPIVKEMETLREKAKMNGHFKNIIPPNF